MLYLLLTLSADKHDFYLTLSSDFNKATTPKAKATILKAKATTPKTKAT